MAELQHITASVLPTICKGCAAPVAQVTRMKREYCSEKCRRAWTRSRRGIVPVCPLCGAEFQRNSARQKVCGPCRPLKTVAYSREYSVANADEVKRKRREDMARRRANDPEKVRQSDRAWLARNREAVNARRRSPDRMEKVRNRMRNDYATKPRVRIHVRMAAAVYAALREKKAGRKWETVVGYTVSDLMRHLERQFSKGMTWENMGEWHIDHIIPKAAFIYETEQDEGFKATWALTNLRPLWAIMNQRKHAKRTLLL